MRQRIAKVLEWERRYAEQLALQDPREKRRRTVLAKNNSEDGSDLGIDQPIPSDDWPDTIPEYFMEDPKGFNGGDNQAQVIIFEYIPKHPVIIPGYASTYSQKPSISLSSLAFSKPTRGPSVASSRRAPTT